MTIRVKRQQKSFGAFLRQLGQLVNDQLTGGGFVERALPAGAVYTQVANAAWKRYPEAYLTDIYLDDNGAIFAIFASEGKLYRSDVTISGDTVSVADWRPVSIQTTDAPAADGEADEMRNRPTQFNMRREKDAAGVERVRWFSQSCTAVLNRVGQLDTTALFDSFVDHAERTGDYPIRQFFHAGENYRTGKADFVARVGNVYITSGLFDDTDIARAEIAAREADPDFWGESIGFDATKPPELIDVGGGVVIPAYYEGINTEISTLPEADAAALFTRTAQEVTRMALTSRQMQAWVKLWGGDEEKARAWLEAHPDETNRAIAAQGLIARAGESAPAEAAPAISASGAAANVTATNLTTGQTVAVNVATPEAVINRAEPDEPEDDDSEDAADQPNGEDAPADDESADDETAADDENERETIIDESVILAVADAVIASDTFVALANRVAMLETSSAERSRLTSGQQQRNENTFAALEARIDALEGDEQTKRQTWQADLPRNASRQRVSFRPRADAPTEGETADASMASTAAQTLAAIDLP